MDDAASDLLLTNDVALLSLASAGTVRAWERRGLLRAVRTAGGTRVFRRQDVEEFLRQRQARRRGARRS